MQVLVEEAEPIKRGRNEGVLGIENSFRDYQCALQRTFCLGEPVSSSIHAPEIIERIHDFRMVRPKCSFPLAQSASEQRLGFGVVPACLIYHAEIVKHARE
jgi:hypothetical protein